MRHTRPPCAPSPSDGPADAGSLEDDALSHVAMGQKRTSHIPEGHFLLRSDHETRGRVQKRLRRFQVNLQSRGMGPVMKEPGGQRSSVPSSTAAPEEDTFDASMRSCGRLAGFIYLWGGDRWKQESFSILHGKIDSFIH